MAQQVYANRAIALDQIDLQVVAQHMYMLMFRNISSDGFMFTDPVSPTKFSLPGCIIAAPSFPSQTPDIDQDYVFHWVRDSAITAMEIAAANNPPVGSVETLVNYVNFSQTCMNSAVQANVPTRACFKIEGTVRDWTDQSDGPALQTLAILRLFNEIDEGTQATALALANSNVALVLNTYRQATYNLWEEVKGYSFFARAVQLRCLQEVQGNKIGITVPKNITDAIAWLKSALQDHWNGQIYVSILNPEDPRSGYDPNIDIICASVYGAIPFTDTKLLATAAQIRTQYTDPNNTASYPINTADAALGIGPLLGRYPGDTYDGNMGDDTVGHPWAVCTANLAEVYYGLASVIAAGAPIPLDDLSATFFAQIGVYPGASSSFVVTALRNAGDAMLRAVIYHSDNLELSEQFDKSSGYEKSVRNLTWSYAAYLSAVRRRNQSSVAG